MLKQIEPDSDDDPLKLPATGAKFDEDTRELPATNQYVVRFFQPQWKFIATLFSHGIDDSQGSQKVQKAGLFSFPTGINQIGDIKPFAPMRLPFSSVLPFAGCLFSGHHQARDTIGDKLLKIIVS